MCKKMFGVLRHAFVMVGRTIKSYTLLSVTIILSFSLFLGYLLYTDASLYNQYKNLFSRRRGDVVINDYPMNDEKLNIFLQNLEQMGEECYYISYYGHFGHHISYFKPEGIELESRDYIQLGNLDAIFVPDNVWIDALEHQLGTTEIVWVDGEQHESLVLEADQVIISEKLYNAFQMASKEEPVFELRSSRGASITLRVAGYLKSAETIDYSEHSWIMTPPMVLSTKLIEAADLMDTSVWKRMEVDAEGMGMIDSRYIVIHSDSPEEVVALAKTMGFLYIFSVYEAQNEALEQIRNEKGNKAVIACALLLLLGINLYSSFTNALNDRKFEIGVKRAIGASGWSIVRQFLYESLIVMAANIFISIALVTDVFIVYKFIIERTPDEWGNYTDWILYISPHSAAMFAVCAVTLTVVFSLIFAYKSTRVEIVQYLKAE